MENKSIISAVPINHDANCKLHIIKRLFVKRVVIMPMMIINYLNKVKQMRLHT